MTAAAKGGLGLATGLVGGCAYAWWSYNEAKNAVMEHKLKVTKSTIDEKVFFVAPYGVVTEGNLSVRPGGRVATYEHGQDPTYHPNQHENIQPVLRFMSLCTALTRPFDQDQVCSELFHEMTLEWQNKELRDGDIGHVRKIHAIKEVQDKQARDLLAEALFVSAANGMSLDEIFNNGPEPSNDNLNDDCIMLTHEGDIDRVTTCWGEFSTKKPNPPLTAANVLLAAVKLKKIKDKEGLNYSVIKTPSGHSVNEVSFANAQTSKKISWHEYRNSVIKKVNDMIKDFQSKF